MDKIAGNSRVQPSFRITLTKEVRRKLKIKVGDMVIYVEDERGNIILKKAELKPV
jgi:AbrB family looped-hinge helix DNA binding protein